MATRNVSDNLLKKPTKTLLKAKLLNMTISQMTRPAVLNASELGPFLFLCTVMRLGSLELSLARHKMSHDTFMLQVAI